LLITVTRAIIKTIDNFSDISSLSNHSHTHTTHTSTQLLCRVALKHETKNVENFNARAQ